MTLKPNKEKEKTHQRSNKYKQMIENVLNTVFIFATKVLYIDVGEGSFISLKKKRSVISHRYAYVPFKLTRMGLCTALTRG